MWEKTKVRRWTTPPNAEHEPISEDELATMDIGDVWSFDLGRLRVSMVKTHPERWTLHTRTVPIGLLVGLPATRRYLTAAARREL